MWLLGVEGSHAGDAWGKSIQNFVTSYFTNTVEVANLPDGRLCFESCSELVFPLGELGALGLAEGQAAVLQGLGGLQSALHALLELHLEGRLLLGHLQLHLFAVQLEDGGALLAAPLLLAALDLEAQHLAAVAV